MTAYAALAPGAARGDYLPDSIAQQNTAETVVRPAVAERLGL